MVTAISTIFTVLLVLVGTILGGMLLALCTPVHVRGRVSKPAGCENAPLTADGVTWHADARWLFGLVRVSTYRASRSDAGQQVKVAGIRVARAPRPTEQKEGKKGRPKEAGDKKRQRKRKTKLPNAQVIQTIAGELPWFIRRTRRAFSGRLRGDVTYGFHDPAYTGMSQGLWAAWPRPRNFVLTPYYEDACLHGWMAGWIRMYPITFVAIGLRGLFRPRIRRLWWPRLRASLPFSRVAS